MPVQYVVINGGRLVIEKWTGVISHDELVSHEREQLQDCSILPGAAVISDCRDAIFKTPPEKVSELSENHNRSGNMTYFSKCAVIVKDEDGFTKARIFAGQIKLFGVNSIVFSSLDVACTWLGLSVVRLEQLLEAT